ncbi:calpain-1 catalytic subunit-like [Chanos chanos]|uniref:Calpain-1 catalytic subunit-like n=1 Tax=Chanos chanos TaxID=29144 RepID=A0A6J2W5U6_CHACN|nr:calpain-1 catalytic subunit-like [Chanos chanos]
MPPPGVCLSVLSERSRRHGQGSRDAPLKFMDQDFRHLQQYCLMNKLRFTDGMFPPDRKSIGQGVLSPDLLPRVRWLRPQKIVSNPCFILENTSRFDFAQSSFLGNCWFLASLGALTLHRPVMDHVLQTGQTFQDNYAGIFRFRFWRFGEWVEVVIDDKLPTLDGKPIFVHSKGLTEFWPALLEKAYAKVCGSYADMDGGNISEALKDFTGGLAMTFQLNEPPEQLWELMCRAGQSESLMGCITPPGASATWNNSLLPNGLVKEHAYAITAVTEVISNGRPVRLVRIFNPWGYMEWTGDWSDRSPMWKTVNEKTQKLNNITDNGEFWMSMEDFLKNFTQLNICSQSIDVLAGTSASQWTCQFHHGRWVVGTTAGGSTNDLDSFWKNPQYCVRLTKMDDDSTDKDPNILVSLMQKSDKRHRHLAAYFHIGFSIYEVPSHVKGQTGKFRASFFKSHRAVAQTKIYLNAREVIESFRLKPGVYLVVPSTFNPDETSSFILAIFSRTGAKTIPANNWAENDERASLFLKYTDQYEEVDAEQLQKLLNENLLSGFSQKKANFSLDSSRSIVAVMDLSVSGRLNEDEFIRLWKRAVLYRDIFYRTNVSQTGNLSMNELRNALETAGFGLNDHMLNLMALRYGGSTGEMSLESFICLILRMESMAKTFRKIAAGGEMHLGENEWMYLTMYS